MINLLKEKLEEAIKKYGICSREVYHASTKVDEEIAKYYQETSMKYFYDDSLDAFNQYVHTKGEKPSTKQWNTIAKNDGYLCSESLKYMGDIKLK